MITNERQYKITRAEAEKFKGVLSSLEKTQKERTDVHPKLLKAERDALESQLDDLLIELAEYEELQRSEAPIIEVNNFAEMADGLIKARIAAGLSQKDLANRLGLKQQQIQRYEAEKYSGASLKRINEVIDALEVRVRNDILVPFEASDFDGLTKKIGQVGVDLDFLSSRLIGTEDYACINDNLPLLGESRTPVIGRVADTLDRIFGWSPDELLGSTPLEAPQLAAASARFKMPAQRSQNQTSVYAAYAHYLALIVLNAKGHADIQEIPDDPSIMYQKIMDRYGKMDLHSALHYAWDLGVPVIPLNDKGTFHGACWRYGGRNVIVLKQRSVHMARWLFDLIHELYHASQHPKSDTFEVIEADENSAERRESEEEIMASQFAGEVVLNGRAEELAQICVSASGGRVQALKKVVSEIAELERVDVGSLANFMAFRMSWQGLNWWGAAANLQKDNSNPWLVARDVFYERFSFDIEDSLDLVILKRALERS